MKQIKFNNITTAIRTNTEGKPSLTDIEQSWVNADGTGGRLKDWKKKPEVKRMVQMGEISLFEKRGNGGGTWGCERAAILYASYCSTEFQLAVVDAFIAASKGDGKKAIVIAQSTMDLREAMKDVTKSLGKVVTTAVAANDSAFNGSVDKVMRHVHGLVCKAVTGLDTVAFKNRYGMPARDFLLQQNDAKRLALMTRIEGKAEAWVEAGMGHEAIKERLAPDIQKAQESWPYPIPQPTKKKRKEAA